MEKIRIGEFESFDEIIIMNSPSKIISQLYLGNIHHAKDISLLQELQIKNVLSVTNSHETKGLPKFHLYNIQNRHYEKCDNPTEDLLTIFIDCIQFINQAINVRHENILIHCHMGVSRSVTIVMAYLLSKWHLSIQDTLLFVRTKRPLCNPNEGFIYQLNLFGRMNYRLDIRNKEFRQYLFYRTIFPFLSIDHLHQMIDRYFAIIQQYERQQQQQQQQMDLNIQQQQQWYRCRRCSMKLFQNIHLLESNLLLFQYRTTIRSLVRKSVQLRELSGGGGGGGGKNSVKLSDFDFTINKIVTKTNSKIIDCNRFLVEPLSWMIVTTIKDMDIDYQLQCPGCANHIGMWRIQSMPKILCKCQTHCECLCVIGIVIDRIAVIIQ
ncbi:dual specificity protein phosphatase 12 [Dermatophagoides farinae]|uniref:dual specificity protein phosphatase 12 n=1 Tax=Dermatophagoides farinae TaxID=6954 RepID=UPI003F5FF5B5